MCAWIEEENHGTALRTNTGPVCVSAYNHSGSCIHGACVCVCHRESSGAGRLSVGFDEDFSEKTRFQV